MFKRNACFFFSVCLFFFPYPQDSSGVSSSQKPGQRNAGLPTDETSRLYVKKTIVVGNVSKLVSKVSVMGLYLGIKWNKRLKLGDKVVRLLQWEVLLLTLDPRLPSLSICKTFSWGKRCFNR